MYDGAIEMVVSCPTIWGDEVLVCLPRQDPKNLKQWNDLANKWIAVLVSLSEPNPEPTFPIGNDNAEAA